MAKVILKYCETYDTEKIYKILQETIIQLSPGKFVSPGDKVLIKPNLLGAHNPDSAVTTHPEFLRAVIKLVKYYQGIPIVADSPSVTNTEEVFIKTGTKQVCSEENVELVNINTYPVIEINFNKFGLEKLHITKLVQEVDYIISLPKLKTHSLTIFTCAIKNMFGIVPGLTKPLYHKFAPHPEDFMEILLTIYNYRKPDLTIVDGILGMDGDGPASGKVKKFNLILISENGMCIDTFLAKIMKVHTTTLYRFLSSQDIPEIVFPQEDKFKTIQFVLPKTVSIVTIFPKWVLNILKNYVWYRPKILQEICKKCGKCYEICPMKTIKYVENKYIILYNNCISCFCCFETCPYKSIIFDESRILRLYRIIKNLIK